MSWQTYVDQQIRDKIDCKLAVMAGLADGQVWASHATDGTTMATPAELKAIADSLKSHPGTFLERGIRLGGEKYMCLNIEDNLIRARLNNCPLTIVATNMCLICVVGVADSPPGKLNTVVETLADYLKTMRY
ncbi:unnamed protein product [Medioppia subpectinata]|uniref:Profilin n=1 Tax=Medioppia subpectinata TaxID=1979941 RepID=A0A7R9L6C2_9ACAR|nr:unnamed protein product [Medioppia subpectinata]CAG2116327.1 unnamed protein product [Medioppia subpectinata]